MMTGAYVTPIRLATSSLIITGVAAAAACGATWLCPSAVTTWRRDAAEVITTAAMSTTAPATPQITRRGRDMRGPNGEGSVSLCETTAGSVWPASFVDPNAAGAVRDLMSVVIGWPLRRGHRAARLHQRQRVPGQA